MKHPGSTTEVSTSLMYNTDVATGDSKSGLVEWEYFLSSWKCTLGFYKGYLLAYVSNASGILDTLIIGSLT